MFSSNEYQLIDFGAGRRLERFGALVLDRPCPVAIGIRRAAPALWSGADARFVEQNEDAKTSKNAGALGFRGVWKATSERGRQFFELVPDAQLVDRRRAETLSSRPWTIRFGERFVLELKGSPFGHVGVFPEQAENWDRIFALCREGAATLGRPLRVLNLFGYTGGSALAAAAAGAETTHLDAARNIVAQARRNAELSFATSENTLFSESTPSPSIVSPDVCDGGANAGSIRWIVDDAVKFVKRELKRGAFYDGIILDPPTYGHGARGEVWRLSRDFEPLLRLCAALTSDAFSFVLATCHTPGFEAPKLERLLRTTFRERVDADKTNANLRVLSKPLEIASERNGALPAGDLATLVQRPRH